MPKLLIHFARFGPYHHARLLSAYKALTPLGWEVIGLEIAGDDDTYAWDITSTSASSPQIVTIFPQRVYEELTFSEIRSALKSLLNQIKPDAMAIAGWASKDAIICTKWCCRNQVHAIVMSETRAKDGKRIWWKELIKRQIIRRFDHAIVGGKSHRDYLVKLGMKSHRIAEGYNVVDNEYFDRASAERKFDITPYFLASNRFIERKNLMRLIEAYSICIRTSERPLPALCLLGDGEQKNKLIARCKELQIEFIESAPWETFSMDYHNASGSNTVYFPGFRQIEELPTFYIHATCFIHPALEEPWGLVINEAMACGLPILSSENVGAAETLVDHGINGWKFSPEDTQTLAKYMLEVSQDSFPREKFSRASLRILAERAPSTAFGEAFKKILDQ